MTIEQLMLPRIRVEIPIPFQPEIMVGAIFYLKDFACTGFAPAMCYHNPRYGNVMESEERRCPQTFKQLQWWEYRELSELPKYVKLQINEKYVTKVENYFVFIREHNIENWLPITEQDYINHLNAQK